MHRFIIPIALFSLLFLAACSAKQVQTSQATAQTAAGYVAQAQAALDVFQSTYGDALELFASDQAKVTAICAKVDPYLAKAKASLAAAGALAEVYASTPLPTTWEELRTNQAAVAGALISAGIELAKLVKEFQG